MSLVPYDSEGAVKGFAALPPRATRARGPVLAGFVIIALAFGGFGAWAATSPLASAAIAPGFVTVEGNRKTVQHLEGGIISEILAAEGDRVEAGQVLVRLDPTRIQAVRDLLRGRMQAAQALEARLIAERDGHEAVAFPDDLTAQAGDAATAEILKGQLNLFGARRDALRGQVSVLKQRIVQHKEQIGGVRAQISSKREQLALVAEEREGIETLFKKGIAPKPKLLAAKRAEARLRGEIGEHVSEVAELKQRSGETELRIIDLQNRFLEGVVTDLRATQDSIAELTDRLRAQEDVLHRLEIRAPQEGIVVGLKFFTAGGVIPPGAPILDIVPENEKLIIQVQIKSTDIDVVHVGLPAQVRLSAFALRTTPLVDATVVNVSADRFVSDLDGSSFYRATVEINPGEMEALDGIELQPGMPVEVLIETGTQTALSYLMSPITSNIHRALRED